MIEFILKFFRTLFFSSLTEPLAFTDIMMGSGELPFEILALLKENAKHSLPVSQEMLDMLDIVCPKLGKTPFIGFRKLRELFIYIENDLFRDPQNAFGTKIPLLLQREDRDWDIEGERYHQLHAPIDDGVDNHMVDENFDQKITPPLTLNQNVLTNIGSIIKM
jgi:hypothetical protein